MSMQNIENLARDFSDARTSLAAKVQTYQDELEKVKRKHFAGIKRAAEAVTVMRDRLASEIESHPELFVKPKSVVLHGVRVGFQKGKGAIEWDDEEKVVALIKKHLPEQAEVLLRVTERPVKTALQQLQATDLKRIGVTIVDAGDEVLIKPVDGEVEKLVDALLRAEEQAAVQEAA